MTAPAPESIAQRVGTWSRRLAARTLVARAVDPHVDRLEPVPNHGPAILAARHYHHLYDATAILATVAREIHIVAALDWLGGGARLRLMRWLAGAAHWSGVWRSGSGWRFNRDGYRQSLTLLREGRALLVFPEGPPHIDPVGSRAHEDADGRCSRIQPGRPRGPAVDRSASRRRARRGRLEGRVATDPAGSVL